MAGLEKIYIDEFRRFNKTGEINRFNLKSAHRNLNFGNWKPPRGSQNIPMMCNMLFADSKSWEWLWRYYEFTEQWFLDYEGPVSRMKTPWVVASLAYAFNKMPSYLQDRTLDFLDTLFVFCSLMTVDYTWSKHRKGQSIMCSGPRSPASKHRDHPLNDMISIIVDPTVHNAFRGQSMFWSSETFRQTGIYLDLSGEAIRDNILGPSPRVLRDVRDTLTQIRFQEDTGYIILKYPGVTFSAYTRNANQYEQPVMYSLARQRPSGEMVREEWPSGDTFRRPVPVDGDFHISTDTEKTTVTMKYGGLEKRVQLPPPERLIYSYIANEDGYLFTRGNAGYEGSIN